MQITFRDVSYIYESADNKNTLALDQINLDLSGRMATAIVGKTGSGKSTAMQHLNGLLQPTEGSVVLGEKIIDKKRNKDRYFFDIRKKIGYVFQNPQYQLFANSVIEDVMYGPINFGFTKEEAKKRAIEALKLVDFPESLYQRYPFELSGGEMRKVAIAGVLAYQPKCLILDEPTVGLDPLATQHLVSTLKKLRDEQGIQLIFITHDMEFAYQLAKDVVVFSEGNVAFDGNIAMLFYNQSLLHKVALIPPIIYQLYFALLKKKNKMGGAENISQDKLITINNIIQLLKEEGE